MVYSSRNRSYYRVVKVNAKRIMTSFFTVLGVFIVATVTIFIITRVDENADKSMAFIAVISGGIAAGLSFPVLIWFALRPPQLGKYSAYALEELTISEEELTEAVGNWVYVKYRQRTEDVPSFLEDEDGNVTCRVTVRKE